MAKKRIHELAKELKLTSKEVMAKLAEMGIDVKSHMSTINESEAEQFIKKIKEKEQKKWKKTTGPGLVNGVPQRPPDRRFQERPFRGQKKRRTRPRAGKKKGDQKLIDFEKATAEKRLQAKNKVDVQLKASQKAPVKEYDLNKKEALKSELKGKEKETIFKRKSELKTREEKPAQKEMAKKIEEPKQEKKEPWHVAQQKQKAKSKVKKADMTIIKKEKDKAPLQRQKVTRKKPIVLEGPITVQQFAVKMQKKPAELIKKLMDLGVMATINQEIDVETAVILGNEFGYEIEVKTRPNVEEKLIQLEKKEDDPADLQPRPPVVTVMGHVDHGKTSLLDAIRHTKVTADEVGGITQHIGAYQIDYKGRKITFIDTPGHEAFTAMRARGAQVTDITILVVAADDGVMPQTVEAINHAKAAEVPIIVAINKIDRPDANSERVKQQLTEYGLVPEEWGGETICVEVSALKKTGLDELLEMILLVGDMHEFKANPDRRATGTVIEAELDKGRGPVAAVLVLNGTLKVGDIVIAGSAFGRVRAMINDVGKRVKKAGPSVPVEVLGFSEVPTAGDTFQSIEDEKLARQVAEKRQKKRREEELRLTSKVSLEDFFKKSQDGEVKELPIIVKADVQGSVEALKQALQQLDSEEVKINIIHGGVGAITETDIMLASASNAMVIGFNVRPDVNARKAAELEKVDIRVYRVIYDAIEDIKAAMSGLLEPEYTEVNIGRAQVRKTFKVSKVGTIAGCYVTEGKVLRGAGARLIRDGVVVHEGKIDSLKRFKDDAREVVQGYECGLTLERFNDIKENDVIEIFEMRAVKRELS